MTALFTDFMIRLYVTDYSALDAETLAPFNPNKRTPPSFAAHRALEKLYLSTYGSSTPQIKVSDSGKPYFDQDPNGASFSLSHTQGYAVALLTDEGECGVDIEIERDSVCAERIDKRFLSDLRLNMPTLDTRPTILFDRLISPVSATHACELTAGARKKEMDRIIYRRSDKELTEHASVSGELTAIARWTLLEAVLKADGRGFTAYKSAQRIIADCAACHYVLTDGEKEIYISVAIKRK